MWKINALIWFQHKEEEKIKENARRRGCTFVGTPKGISHQ